jgi:predicted Zn-dependent peptidase
MKYKKTILNNGLRIITVPVRNTQTVTVVIMVGVGSRYEKDKEAGLSHFIEHMFFKGTKKRQTTLDITSELDAIGGEYNAFTTKDKTGYYAKVDAKHIDVALDVVSDIFLNSKIEEKEIEKEKGTIVQEINLYEDTPISNIGNVFENLLYPQNSLGRDTIGFKKTVQSLKRNDFINYMNRFYVAGDTVICVAGKFDEKEVVRKIKKYFSKMKKGRKTEFKKVAERQAKPAVKIKYKKTDQTHLIIGNRGYHQDHKDRYALGLLAVILGGNMSSRLFIEVREKRGLAYYVRTDTETYKDAGYIATQAGVDHKDLELTVRTILDEYKKISEKKVKPEELQRAKDFVKGRAIMGYEASDEIAMFFIDQEMRRNKILTLEQILKKIDAVKIFDIQRVAKDVFQEKKLNLALIGPHEDSNKLKNILNI